MVKIITAYSLQFLVAAKLEHIFNSAYFLFYRRPVFG